MTLRERIAAAFLRRFIATPEGRAHILHQLADAEGNGENGFFESLLARVDDPDLARLVRKHKEDELRHEELFLARALAQGVPLQSLPDEVKYVERLFESVGFEDKPIDTTDDLVEAYALLQAVEERSVTQFAQMERAFDAVGDKATAAVFRQVSADEARHIRYCQAIAKKYQPDAARRAEVLARMRTVEARAFVENGSANLELAIARGFFQGGPFARFFFRTLQWLGAQNPPLTPFATEKEAALYPAPVTA